MAQSWGRVRISATTVFPISITKYFIYLSANVEDYAMQNLILLLLVCWSANLTAQEDRDSTVSSTTIYYVSPGFRAPPDGVIKLASPLTNFPIYGNPATDYNGVIDESINHIRGRTSTDTLQMRNWFYSGERYTNLSSELPSSATIYFGHGTRTAFDRLSPRQFAVMANNHLLDNPGTLDVYLLSCDGRAFGQSAQYELNSLRSDLGLEPATIHAPAHDGVLDVAKNVGIFAGEGDGKELTYYEPMTPVRESFGRRTIRAVTNGSVSGVKFLGSGYAGYKSEQFAKSQLALPRFESGVVGWMAGETTSGLIQSIQYGSARLFTPTGVISLGPMAYIQDKQIEAENYAMWRDRANGISAFVGAEAISAAPPRTFLQSIGDSYRSFRNSLHVNGWIPFRESRFTFGSGELVE